MAYSTGNSNERFSPDPEGERAAAQAAATARSADDALPPVEPPSAGFIVQLFVVPGVIVAAIVLVWLLVTWIAQAGDDPRQHFEALKQGGPKRWQAAQALASALQARRPTDPNRGPTPQEQRHDEFKRDSTAAAELAVMLEDEMNAGSQLKDEHALEQSITLQQFLARALGEFYVDDGLEMLLKAATTKRSESEEHVRRSAIEAIGVLAGNFAEKNGKPLTNPQLVPTLFMLVEDSNPAVRSTATYAMGVIGGEELTPRLEDLLRDDNADVRYNAAMGLARHGSPRAIPVLLEMLNPAALGPALELEQGPAPDPVQVEAAREHKRVLIMANAMKSTIKLAQQNSEVDVQPLADAINKLADETSSSDPTRRIAREYREQLNTVLANRTEAVSNQRSAISK